jgi:predicted acetyltransferase
MANLNKESEHGLYEYKYVDNYWSEDGRHPCFIQVEEKLAGFALVRERRKTGRFGGTLSKVSDIGGK